MTWEEVRRHPQRNLLMRALASSQGRGGYGVSTSPGDVFCFVPTVYTGLSMTRSWRWALGKHAEFAARTPIDAALDAGGRDNATGGGGSGCRVLSLRADSGGSGVGSARSWRPPACLPTSSAAELLRVQRIAFGRQIKADEVVLARSAARRSVSGDRRQLDVRLARRRAGELVWPWGSVWAFAAAPERQ